MIRRNRANKFVWDSRNELRENMTPTEIRMWNKLRGNKFHGYHWRRQHHIGGSILDYYCADAKLGIELEGGVHDDPAVKKRDFLRTWKLKSLGIRILRFPNIRIIRDWAGVEERILAELRRRCPEPPRTTPEE